MKYPFNFEPFGPPESMKPAPVSENCYNEIILDKSGNTYVGALAQRFANGLLKLPPVFVLDSDTELFHVFEVRGSEVIQRAAQSSRARAQTYMTPDRVCVYRAVAAEAKAKCCNGDFACGGTCWVCRRISEAVGYAERAGEKWKAEAIAGRDRIAWLEQQREIALNQCAAAIVERDGVDEGCAKLRKELAKSEMRAAALIGRAMQFGLDGAACYSSRDALEIGRAMREFLAERTKAG